MSFREPSLPSPRSGACFFNFHKQFPAKRLKFFGSFLRNPHLHACDVLSSPDDPPHKCKHLRGPRGGRPWQHLHTP